MLTSDSWNHIAEAATWAHSNANVLVDSHWIGGNPNSLAVYGWAAWTPEKGTVVLRNPSAETNSIAFEVGSAFELPSDAPSIYNLAPAYADQRPTVTQLVAGQTVVITLLPFEVLVFDALPDPALLPPTITTASALPDGILGALYNQTLQAAGGNGPYIWSVISNSVPAGLALDATSGTVTGTPTAAMTADFIVQVMDTNSRSATKPFSLTINSPTPFQQWQLRYFGCATCPQAAPDADDSGTGQNNLFKYIAGLNPTDPASTFGLRIQAVPGQPNQKELIYQPITSGRFYTLQSATNLATGAWNIQITTAPETNSTQVTVTDQNAAGDSKFYRVVISLTATDSVGDGVPDDWRAQYFPNVDPTGRTTNWQSCATCDASSTGQNNLFKYVAGLDPTNPASVFVLKIANVAGQPTQKQLTFRPWTTGRTYKPQYRTNLVSGSYATLTGYIGPTTNSTEVTVTDTGITDNSRFYRFNISIP
jgi:hypothetical protein